MKIRIINDVAFRHVFGRDVTKENLIHFLNAVLAGTQSEPIADLTLKETDLDPDTIGQKSCRLDIRAVTINGVHINVEVQIQDQADIEKRSLFYWSKLYVSQLQKGEHYRELSPTIAINIMDFSYLAHNKVHSTYDIVERELGLPLTDVFDIHFIELPKLKDQQEPDLTNPLTRWLLFLSDDTDQKLMEEIIMQDKTIHRAKEDLEKLVMDEKALRMYEIREKALLDDRSNIDAATRRGLAKGIKQGIEQGIEQGRHERELRLVQKMIEQGVQDDYICTIAEITQSRLEEYKQQLS